MTFPTTPILDNFNRANEGPPLSANWSEVHPSFLYGSHKVVSNAAVAEADETCNSYWSAETFGPDCEIYATLTDRPPNGYGIPLSLLVIGADIGIAGFSQYLLTIYRNDALGDTASIIRQNIGSLTELIISRGDFTLAAGDSVGFEKIGNDLTFYHKPAAGSWTAILTVTDPSPLPQSTGNLLIQTEGTTYSFDNFGGGTIGAAPPVADFSGTPISGPAPLDVDFTDSSTNDPTEWDWDFGDTYTSSAQNPTHIYDSIGLFAVALTATNDEGSDTETKVDYIEVFGPPVADFSGTPTSGAVSLSVDFTDLSTNSPDSWLWDFGDGGYSTAQNPTYVYTHVGVYTVTLTASSTAGIDSESKIAYITVTAVAEYGAAIIEDCDTNTGGAAVGLRVADVAIARDNILGSLTIDASAELRAKDNAYSTLINNGTLDQLAGDRAAFDTATYFDRHASDIEDASFTYHSDPDNPPLSNYLGSGSIFVGNASNEAIGVAMSGDATIDNAGVLTIGAQAVDESNIALTNGSIFIGGADGAAHEQAVSGDASISNAGAVSLATVNADVGTYGDETHLVQITVDAKGRILAIGEIVFSGGEVLMADGVTPPDPLTTEDETDWLYEG